MTTVARKQHAQTPDQASTSVHVTMDIMEMENFVLVSSYVFKCNPWDIQVFPPCFDLREPE